MGVLPGMERMIIPMPADLAARRAAFRRLHEGGCFLIPNPWDAGSAVYLRHLGFQALATTSSGLAFSRGRPDGAVPVEAVLDHVAAIVAATDLPVNADFESGYATRPAGVADNVRRCVEAGVAGLSIEDSTGDPARPLYELEAAVERVAAARAAIDATGTGVLLTARAECHLVGHPDPLPESIRRLRAYAEAGADVLYAPGPRSREDIAAIVAAVAPRPVNVLMGWSTGLGLADLAALGVRRVSVGSALARAAWTGFIKAADEMAREGTFTALEDTIPFAAINDLFRTHLT
jgi:2-methylisocitrate lyase-like PEP mutase family enzyme